MDYYAKIVYSDIHWHAGYADAKDAVEIIWPS